MVQMVSIREGQLFCFLQTKTAQWTQTMEPIKKEAEEAASTQSEERSAPDLDQKQQEEIPQTITDRRVI